MWGFITGWDSSKKDKPLRLQDYSNMLFPQYADSFTEISKETWEWLQGQAQKNIDEGRDVHPNVAAHWQSIVNGVVPFGYKVSSSN